MTIGWRERGTVAWKGSTLRVATGTRLKPTFRTRPLNAGSLALFEKVFRPRVRNLGSPKKCALCLLSDGDERLCLTAAALPSMLDVYLEDCSATSRRSYVIDQASQCIER